MPAGRSWSDEITERVTLNDPRGHSGNKIERVTLADGRTLILKTVSPASDWIMRATNDDGRIAVLWKQGVFDSMPPSLDHTVVDVEQGRGCWRILMRDVGDVLLRDDISHGPQTARRILAAAADLHDAFWDADIPGLCSIEDRYRLLSPETARREKESGDRGVGEVIEREWAAFYDNTPHDVADVITSLAEDPTPIADELRTCRQTLIHGDLRIGNTGFDRDRTVFIDWGDRTGIAPPSVELAWFIGFDAERLDMTRDDIIVMFRESSADQFDERALHLGLIGGLVHLGAHIGSGFVAAEDGAKRKAAKEQAEWWTRAVSVSLEHWSPARR